MGASAVPPRTVATGGGSAEQGKEAADVAPSNPALLQTASAWAAGRCLQRRQNAPRTSGSQS
eukprot:4912015-Prymnesium_polylepis.1